MSEVIESTEKCDCAECKKKAEPKLWHQSWTVRLALLPILAVLGYLLMCLENGDAVDWRLAGALALQPVVSMLGALIGRARAKGPIAFRLPKGGANG